MTSFVYFLIGLVSGLAILAYPLRNALRLIDQHEELHGRVLDRLRRVIAHIRFVDIRGSFEADDEVGTAFKAIQETIDTLEEFLPENDNEEIS